MLSDTGLLGWRREIRPHCVQGKSWASFADFPEDQSLDLKHDIFKELAFPSEMRLESSLVHSLMPTS